jgi:hypothetical protein
MNEVEKGNDRVQNKKKENKKGGKMLGTRTL